MRGRARRAAVALVVGLIVVLPMSAMAAPSLGVAIVQEKSDSGDPPGTTAHEGKSDEAPGHSEDDERPGKSDEAPGHSEDDERPGKSDEAPGHSEDDERPGKSDEAPGRAIAPGQTGETGSPALTPSGVTPASGATHRDIGQGLGAAMVMLDLGDDGQVSVLVTPAEPPGLSGDLVSVLSPVMPPGLVDAVTSPIVIFEALLEAMASSGQALVIPFLAAAAGFFLPGPRRRDLVAAVVEQA